MRNFLNISEFSSQELRKIIEEAKIRKSKRIKGTTLYQPGENQKEKSLTNQPLTLTNLLLENLWL